MKHNVSQKEAAAILQKAAAAFKKEERLRAKIKEATLKKEQKQRAKEQKKEQKQRAKELKNAEKQPKKRRTDVNHAVVVCSFYLPV